LSFNFLEKQLYEKYLEYENKPNLDSMIIPKDVLTPDRALLLNDMDIYSFATENNFKCEILINPGQYLEFLSSSFFAYQKDFALREILDYHLQKFKQGTVK
jgi:hypothetical protein